MAAATGLVTTAAIATAVAPRRWLSRTHVEAKSPAADATRVGSGGGLGETGWWRCREGEVSGPRKCAVFLKIHLVFAAPWPPPMQADPMPQRFLRRRNS